MFIHLSGDSLSNFCKSLGLRLKLMIDVGGEVGRCNFRVKRKTLFPSV